MDIRQSLRSFPHQCTKVWDALVVMPFIILLCKLLQFGKMSYDERKLIVILLIVNAILIIIRYTVECCLSRKFKQNNNKWYFPCTGPTCCTKFILCCVKGCAGTDVEPQYQQTIYGPINPVTEMVDVKVAT